MVRAFSGPPTSPPPETSFDRHEHEWEPTNEGPIIEDGAAIFLEQCRYAVTKTVDMGKYGLEDIVVGPECDETRSYRFELANIGRVLPSGERITYLASEFDRFSHLPLDDIIVDIEMKGDVVDVDPDRDSGTVRVEYENWRAEYRAKHNPQSDPYPIF